MTNNDFPRYAIKSRRNVSDAKVWFQPLKLRAGCYEPILNLEHNPIWLTTKSDAEIVIKNDVDYADEPSKFTHYNEQGNQIVDEQPASIAALERTIKIIPLGSDSSWRIALIMGKFWLSIRTHGMAETSYYNILEISADDVLYVAGKNGKIGDEYIILGDDVKIAAQKARITE